MTLSYREDASSVNCTDDSPSPSPLGTLASPLVNLTVPPRSPSPKASAAPSGDDTRIPCPHTVVTGVDKLEVTLHLNIFDQRIFEKLSRFKEEVQQGMKTCIALDFGEKDQFSWNLQRIGTKFFPYVLKSGDITLLLSSRSGQSKIPNAQIEIGSVSSQEGAFKIYQDLLGWLEAYGLTIHKEMVGRADLSADFIGQEYGSLDLDNHHRWISKGKKFRPIYDDWKLNTIYLGTSRLLCRIYDKALELKRNKEKQKFFYNLWNCTNDTPVVRVEIQIRRSILKQFQKPINTVKELRENLDSIWQYVTKDWARQTEKKVDRENKNHKQANNSEFWKRVQSVDFKTLSTKIWREVKKTVHKNLQALKDQARGCIINFAAAAGHDASDYYGIINTCCDVLAEDLGSFMKTRFKEFEKLLDIRRNECYVGF